MSLAESAVLLGLHAVRMSFLILRHVVIALLAFCTCQCNLCAHDFHLRLILCKAAFFSACYRKLSIKKRPMFFHSPVYYIIKEAARQAITCRHSPPLLYYRYRFHLVQAGTRFCPRLVFHIIRTYNDAIKQSERFIHPLSPRLQRLSFLPHFHGCLWYPAPPFQAHRFLPHLPPGFR